MSADNHNDGGPAFPVPPPSHNGVNGDNHWNYANPGMTLREYAAIKLKVPSSGNEWLDNMIIESRCADFAAKALQGMLADPDWDDDIYGFAASAYAHADAMLAERERRNGGAK